jgi:hypothetical protein
MRRRDYETAWSISDRVLATRDKRRRDDPEEPYHRRWLWDGTPAEGKEVLVRCYHGLGDTIQFARFLPSLATIAARVTVETPRPLIPLFQRSDLGAAIVPFDPARPRAPSPCDIEIMELSHGLRLSPLAVQPPYLSVDKSAGAAEAVQRAVNPIAALCWRCGDWDHERSLRLRLLREAMPQAWRLVHLQPDITEDEATACSFINPTATLATIIDTARLILSATLVVTIDTMVAHLASALGRPCFVLLKHEADWRWEHGNHSSWYPRSRLIRQPRPGDWTGAVTILKAELARWKED